MQRLRPFVLLLGIVACVESSRSGMGERDAGPEVGDGTPTPDALADLPSGDARDATEDAGAEPADVAAPDDAVSPGDLPPDAPSDVASDLTPPPAGCCADDADCLTDAAVARVCRGQGVGPYPDYGVCMEPPATDRCWSNADCPGIQACVGGTTCGCEAPCEWVAQGVCASPGAACVPIDEGWIENVCDAASIVIFDGQGCRETGPGRCGCQPFCDLTFLSMDACRATCGGCAVFDGSCDDAIPEQPWWYFDGTTCVEEDACVCPGCPGTFLTREACEAACPGPSPCPTWLTAPLEGPFTIWREASPAMSCWQAAPRPTPCASDADCPGPAPVEGPYCVLGSCSVCWADSECGPNMRCRGGRCVLEPSDCPSAPPCEQPGCALVTPSEQPCPVCVCDSPFGRACAYDADCVPLSSHPYRHCVWGRCAECRSDDECAWGQCLPPGVCFEMEPSPWTLVGTWLVGWAGGMDHFSYLRFEPDGTLRRGRYADGGIAEPWSDDFPGLPCWPAGVLPSPLLGTWEPEMTESGFLVVRVSLNVSCDSGAGWSARWLVHVDDAGLLTLDDIDSDASWMGWRSAPDACTPDFSLCDVPTWPL